MGPNSCVFGRPPHSPLWKSLLRRWTIATPLPPCFSVCVQKPAIIIVNYGIASWPLRSCQHRDTLYYQDKFHQRNYFIHDSTTKTALNGAFLYFWTALPDQLFIYFNVLRVTADLLHSVDDKLNKTSIDCTRLHLLTFNRKFRIRRLRRLWRNGVGQMSDARHQWKVVSPCISMLELSTNPRYVLKNTLCRWS